MKDYSRIIDDPIKATLFGRFYEEIISEWLQRRKGYVRYEGKPRVFWKDVQPVKGESEAAKDLRWQLREYKKQKQYCIPDGLFKKDGAHFLWEAKNWPQWAPWSPELNQLKSGLYYLPVVLAKSALYQGASINIDGFLFSWWSKPEGTETVLKELRRITSPRSFDIVYTTDVISDCLNNNYSWYREIVNRERLRANSLFDDLLGGNQLHMHQEQ